MKKFFITCMALLASVGVMSAAPQAEKLDRGVIAVKTSAGVFISWRSLEADNDNMTFDVYRDGTKINSAPITAGTNFSDAAGTLTSKYVIKALVNGAAVETSKETAVEPDVYKRIKLDRPANDSRTSATYSPNDCSVGDVDGDGEYEIFVKWDPSNSQDNSINGKTGNVLIDCYKLDGTKLWRIDLGQNIRAGAHYTQFLVYDFDGDGKAEMMCKTAPGTKDGKGKNVIMGSDDPTAAYANSNGQIITGPEYLTVFNGQTGAEINTIAYNPPRSIQSFTTSGWGDAYGGRSERYLAGVAYLGGENHSAVFCRGYYTYAYLWAVDFDGSKLTQRWLYSSPKSKELYGEGAHSLTVGDVDGDGFDEIIYGAAAVDHDGKFLHRTGAAHGDALHLGDLDPDHEGLEVFMVHEEKGSAFKYDATFRDAKTGEMLWYVAQSGNDIGRGMAADISDKWRGYECWPGAYYEGSTKTNATFDCKGNLLEKKRGSTNFRIYWDGDLLDELFDGCYNSSTGKAAPEITKRNATLTSTSKTWSFSKYSAQSCNTTKATPCLQADILGDWREELILWDGDNSTDLLVFTTTETSKYRVPCLMEDHTYRMAIAWQNTAYNQPPHLGYYLPDRYSTEAQIKVTEGKLTQSLELGYAIEPVKGTFAKCTDLTATGLPQGVTLATDPTTGTFTLSGTPASIGKYTVKITSVGGDPNSTVEGVISVTEPSNTTRVAYFSFDAVGATVTNHVKGEATAVGTPASVAGIVNNAISFDGTAAYLTQGAYDEIQMGTKDFTIELLFKSTDDAAYMIHKGSISAEHGEGATGHWIGLEYKNNLLKFAIDDDAAKSEVNFTATDYFNGSWHHLVLVREGDTKTLKIYADGVLMAEAADQTGSINDNNEALVIGNVNYLFNNFYEGAMDDLSIYTGAMSANKVKERYDSYMNSGIIDTEFVPDLPVELSLYDATTGIMVAHGVGDRSNVLSNAAPGVYILVSRQGKTRAIEKIIL